MVDESTLNFTAILHGTTQTRCIVVAKTAGNALRTLNNISRPFFHSFTIVWHQSCPQSTARIIHPFREKTRPATHKPKRSITTRRHSTSCKLVPHHDRGHNNHSRRLKSPINSIFAILNSFYHPHIAFPFGLPPCHILSRQNQCPKINFFNNTVAKSLSQGASILTRDHNSDPAGSV